MLFGYVRISTDDQLLDLQRDAMAKAGCERVFEDTASGARPIGSAWPRFSPIYGGATRWWSGGWTGLAARSRT